MNVAAFIRVASFFILFITLEPWVTKYSAILLNRNTHVCWSTASFVWKFHLHVHCKGGVQIFDMYLCIDILYTMSFLTYIMKLEDIFVNNISVYTKSRNVGYNQLKILNSIKVRFEYCKISSWLFVEVIS